MLALVNGEPKVLNLKEVVAHYVDYQKEVIVRRTQFELKKAEDRAHILEGLRIALDNIDAIIALIRGAANDQEAKQGLMETFQLSERQAVAILDMQLRRLTGLERDKIEAEYEELQQLIQRLRSILGDMALVYEIIKDELQEIRDKFADPRRTDIVASDGEIEIEDMIAEEDIVVTMTHQGYIKRLPVDTYRSQRRGGRGISALHTKADDFIEQLFVATTHSYVLFFSNLGRVYRLKGHEIPEGSRSSRGTAIINALQLQPGERIQTTIPIDEYGEDQFLLMGTRRGVVKKTRLSEFDSPRTGGLICINLDEGDELVGVRLTDGSEEVLLVSSEAQAIRFPEAEIRAMGRGAHGVKGMTLGKDHCIVGMDVIHPKAEVLVVTENGYGKRTPVEEYRVTRRGGKGVKTLQRTDRTGAIVGIGVVHSSNEIMLISNHNIMIRMSVADISLQSRSTQGVRLMRLEEGDRVVALANLVSKIEE